jgi:quercetin dioxygenase-like cupin family protein
MNNSYSRLPRLTAGLLLAGPMLALAQDPAVVNPNNVRVTLENDRVRVFEAVLRPGEKERPHSHPACVMYVLAGGRIRFHTVGGSTSEVEVATGETTYREPVTHWAENIGTKTISLIVVELKDPG